MDARNPLSSKKCVFYYWVVLAFPTPSNSYWFILIVNHLGAYLMWGTKLHKCPYQQANGESRKSSPVFSEGYRRARSLPCTSAEPHKRFRKMQESSNLKLEWRSHYTSSHIISPRPPSGDRWGQGEHQFWLATQFVDHWQSTNHRPTQTTRDSDFPWQPYDPSKLAQENFQGKLDCREVGWGRRGKEPKSKPLFDARS